MEESLAKVASDVSLLENRMKDLKVTDKESAEFATETAVIASRLYNTLEAKRKAEVGPLNNQVKEVNGRYKKFTDILDAIKSRSKRLVENWMNEQDRIAREAQAKIQAEEATRWQKEQEEADAKGIVAPVVALASLDEVPEEAPKVIQSDTGKAVTRKDWTYEMVNIALVPVKYLVIDNKAVMQAIYSGDRDIPGLRIFQQRELSVR